jgi:hypothetical protein
MFETAQQTELISLYIRFLLTPNATGCRISATVGKIICVLSISRTGVGKDVQCYGHLEQKSYVLVLKKT